MTPQTESFYANTVIAEEFDYTVISNPEPMRSTPEQARVNSRLLRTVTSFAAGGVLVFGPFGVSAPANQRTIDEADAIVVHVKAPDNALVQVSYVAVPDAHRRAAERFRKLFRAVPLDDVEKIPDPDFGL